VTGTDSQTPTYTAAEVAEHRRLWVDTLRSDRYTQGHKVLRGLPDVVFTDEVQDFWQVSEDVRTDLTRSTYCCLGVAECLNEAKWEYDDENDNTPFLVVADDDVETDQYHFENRTDAMLTLRTARWLGLVVPDPVVVVFDDVTQRWVGVPLSVLNDSGLDGDDESGAWTFTMIADAIAAQPPDWDGDDESANDRARALNGE
jgi:hypothetical protein